ncbi:DUF2863 family protein [Kerstersia sp.]|uniref:DUF2863 family protein n=1 Tax=Kerstersia sp. TaxID=1930783 RepID=UPI003F9265B3
MFPTQRSSQRPSRDAARLVSLATALGQSGCRTEDRYWEKQLEMLLGRLLRTGNDAALENALEHLLQNDQNAYGLLVELIETLSESTTLAADEQRYDVVLITAPVLAWTRFQIPHGGIPARHLEALTAQMSGHILSSQAKLALYPQLIGVDQLPRSFSETWQWLQALGNQALGKRATRLPSRADADVPPMLADTRYLVGAVAVPEGEALFAWQETASDTPASRESCQAAWAEQAGPSFAALLPGCAVEIMLPDAYYVSNRDSDKHIRPLALTAAVNWLHTSVGLETGQLRAVICRCSAGGPEEFRISLGVRDSNDVYYGCIWPIFGRDEDIDGDATDLYQAMLEQISAHLNALGVHEIRRLPGVFPPENCDDCGGPLFPNAVGEMVHAELPEDLDIAPGTFH